MMMSIMTIICYQILEVNRYVSPREGVIETR